MKLRKKESGATWDQGLGYDISEFTLPNAGGKLKSNFIVLPPAPVVVLEAKQELPKSEVGEDKENEDTANQPAAEEALAKE